MHRRGNCVAFQATLVLTAALGLCASPVIDTQRFGSNLLQHLSRTMHHTIEVDIKPRQGGDQHAYDLLENAYEALHEQGDALQAEAKTRECLKLAPQHVSDMRAECLLLLLEILEKQDRLAQPLHAMRILDTITSYFESSTGVDLPSRPSEWRSIFSKFFLALLSLRGLHEVQIDSIHHQVFEATKSRTRWIHPWQIPDGSQFVDDSAIEGPLRQARPYWPTSEFPNMQRQLEDVVFPAIVEELPAAEGLWQEHFETELKSGASSWQEIRLYEMSEALWSEKRCKVMSKTCNALQQIDRLMQRIRPTGSALPHSEGVNIPGRLSLLRLPPGSSLVPHTGSANARLSFHMGVELPPPLEFIEGVPSNREAASLTVGNFTARWRVGKVIFWDDSFVHSVRNDHPSVERVVFTGHFFKPALGSGEVVAYDKTWEVIPTEEGHGSVSFGLLEDERRALAEGQEANMSV
eukprot:g935.t1